MADIKGNDPDPIDPLNPPTQKQYSSGGFYYNFAPGQSVSMGGYSSPVTVTISNASWAGATLTEVAESTAVKPEKKGMPDWVGKLPKGPKPCVSCKIDTRVLIVLAECPYCAGWVSRPEEKNVGYIVVRTNATHLLVSGYTAVTVYKSAADAAEDGRLSYRSRQDYQVYKVSTAKPVEWAEGLNFHRVFLSEETMNAHSDEYRAYVLEEITDV